MKNSELSKAFINKIHKKYFHVENKRVLFTGDFDSGNLQRVQQISQYQYRITPGFDNPYQSSTQKIFFHFKVSGFSECRVRFRITPLKLLNIFSKNNDDIQLYKPVCKVQNGDYQKLKQPIKIIQNSNQVSELIFQYDFQFQQYVYFAFSYPYSYQKNLNLLQQLQSQLENDKQIYFHNQVLIQSCQNRIVNLITLTNRQNCFFQKQQPIQGLFPEIYQCSRPFKIKNRPKVLVTARIHPGQTASSYVFEGLLRFLADKKDYRAHLLRKYFHFLLIPMMNPDGVARGMYRLDLHFNNLNRFYGKSNQVQQPTVWAVQTLTNQIGAIDFYYDLHGHASKKDFFVYGNAFQQIHYQAQAETFAKILQINCPFFEYSESNFTKKQMKSKDIHDQLTKQGCGRVFMHHKKNIIHSYTFECGFHYASKLNKIVPPKQTKIHQKYEYKQTYQDDIHKFYTPHSYMNLGKNILVTLLDIFQKNPYSRIQNSEYKQLNQIRRTIFLSLHQNTQRFKNIVLDIKKLKNINQMINQYYISKFIHTPIFQNKNQQKYSRSQKNSQKTIQSTRQISGNPSLSHDKNHSNPISKLDSYGVNIQTLNFKNRMKLLHSSQTKNVKSRQKSKILIRQKKNNISLLNQIEQKSEVKKKIQYSKQKREQFNQSIINMKLDIINHTLNIHHQNEHKTNLLQKFKRPEKINGLPKIEKKSLELHNQNKAKKIEDIRNRLNLRLQGLKF